MKNKFVVADFDVIPEELPIIKRDLMRHTDLEVHLAYDAEQLVRIMVNNEGIRLVCIITAFKKQKTDIKMIISIIRKQYEAYIAVISTDIKADTMRELYKFGADSVMVYPNGWSSHEFAHECVYRYLGSWHEYFVYMTENCPHTPQSSMECIDNSSNPIFSKTFPKLIINPLQRTVILGGSLIKMPALEFDILLLLARNAGNVVNTTQIMNDVWGTTRITPSEFTSYISRIRKKIERNPEKHERIITFHRCGYKLLSENVEICQ